MLSHQRKKGGDYDFSFDCLFDKEFLKYRDCSSLIMMENTLINLSDNDVSNIKIFCKRKTLPMFAPVTKLFGGLGTDVETLLEHDFETNTHRFETYHDKYGYQNKRVFTLDEFETACSKVEEYVYKKNEEIANLGSSI